MREIVGIGGDNESGPRTGKRKRAGNGESVLQPGPQGRVGRRQCKAEGPEGRQNDGENLPGGKLMRRQRAKLIPCLTQSKRLSPPPDGWRAGGRERGRGAKRDVRLL